MGAVAVSLRGLLLAPMLLLSQTAWSEVYRWLDESGRVHFGDHPPAEAAADVEPVELSIPPADPKAGETYSIENQLERMEQARAEREAARPEPAPEATPEPTPPAAPNEVRTYWGPGYYRPPPRPRPPTHPPLPHPPGAGGPRPEPRPPVSGRLQLPHGIAPPIPSR